MTKEDDSRVAVLETKMVHIVEAHRKHEKNLEKIDSITKEVFRNSIAITNLDKSIIDMAETVKEFIAHQTKNEPKAAKTIKLSLTIFIAVLILMGSYMGFLTQHLIKYKDKYINEKIENHIKKNLTLKENGK